MYREANAVNEEEANAVDEGTLKRRRIFFFLVSSSGMTRHGDASDTGVRSVQTVMLRVQATRHTPPVPPSGIVLFVVPQTGLPLDKSVTRDAF